MNTVKVGTSDRVTDAHHFGVSIACCKKDLVKYYNEQGLKDATTKYDFASFDTCRHNNSLELSSENEPLDKLIEIPSRAIFGSDSPVRVLRAVEAMNGSSIRTFPKHAIGIFKSATIDLKEHVLSTARIEFREDSLIWTSTIEMVCEEFDSDMKESNFHQNFFGRYSHRTHIPIKLAYAVTVYSLQGLEFNNLIFDMSSIGDWLKHGLYMGVTRVRSPRGIWCLNVPDANSNFNNNDRDTRQLYIKLKEISERQAVLENERKESLVTMDLVQIMENFKVTFILIVFIFLWRFIDYFFSMLQPMPLMPYEDIESQALKFVHDLSGVSESL